MSIHGLDTLFHPRSVAIVGATDRLGAVGRAVVDNLRRHGFAGAIHPVNSNRRTVLDLPAVPSLEDIGGDVDLVIHAAPIISAPETVAAAGRMGAAGVVILSSGGGESGPAGRDTEQRLLDAAAPSGIRVVGPNCLGIICARAHLNATFATTMPRPGNMAFVSQSGAVCTAVLDLCDRVRIGFSHFMSLGCMLDVNWGDMIDYLGSLPEVACILIYMEQVGRARHFMSAARSVSRTKPIIVLKAGRSRAGTLAAASHTGAMAGNDAAYDAAFARAGVVRVRTFEELFDCAEIVARGVRPRRPALAVLTNAGGPGVLAVDALADHGEEPAVLEPATLARLNAVLPPHWSQGNPVDMLGDATPERYAKALRILLDAPEVEGVLAMWVAQAISGPEETAHALVAALHTAQGGATAAPRKPVMTCWLGGPLAERGRASCRLAEVAAFDTPERAVRAFMNLHHHARNLEALWEIPPRHAPGAPPDRDQARLLLEAGLARQGGLLTEAESKAVLAAYGVPCVPCTMAYTAGEAARAAEALGFPVALKIASPDITHKSDVGGVVLGLASVSAVRFAFAAIMAKVSKARPDAVLDGVTVQPMRTSPYPECILGARLDPDFGPLILFGAGGTATEILHDTAMALPPLNRPLVSRLVDATRAGRLLSGFRGLPPVDRAPLEDAIIGLSALVTDFPCIAELDVNPLLVWSQDVAALDARIVVRPNPTPPPLHCVISPYPAHYERRVRTAGGVDILVRPIRPEDADLFDALFASLSNQSVYFRFFRPLRQLPHDMLVRFTQVDYDREIALVAIADVDGVERMLGVARVITELDGVNAEFSVMVGDAWQGKGVGAELLRDCLCRARQQGIHHVRGVVLPENAHMLALGRKLGFASRRSLDSGECALDKDLGMLELGCDNGCGPSSTQPAPPIRSQPTPRKGAGRRRP
ncbi:MAG: GNAT family N-acetyltransferase [Desulfovibrionaceae bacterium]